MSTAQQARKESSGRLQALQGTKAALSGVQAMQANERVGLEDGEKGSGFAVSVSLGSQKSSSTQKQEQSMASGSTLNAGNNLTVTATGKHGEAGSGDIAIGGSQLKAGGDVTLDAQRDLLLSGAANMQKTEGSNKSSGLSIFANANSSKGSEHGDGTRWNETTIDSGNKVTLHSGRDTTLKGAQVSGEQVSADVGRNLSLTSERDSDRYDAKQQSGSAGGSFTFGSMNASAGVSASRDKLHSNYDSVQEQTGIFAGKGGFDVKVGEHTQLEGAVIGSTATADKNRLETGTLGFKDIHNQADFKTEHQSMSVSTSGNVGGQFLGNVANNLLVGANNEGHASSTTKSAVSEGAIVIRDPGKQQQDVNELSRDVEHANQALSPIFDKEKEQNRLKEAQLIGEIGSQLMNIAETEGAIAATKEAREKQKDPAALAAAREKLEKEGKPATAEAIQKQAYETAYNQALNDSGFGTGGKVQRAMQAATAVIQGLAGGDLTKAIAGGSAPYIANIIGSSGLDDAGKVLAHAAVNAALAAAQGNNALVGAGGAATGELIGMIAVNAYGRPVSELSETEKQTVSALATLASGLAGGLIGGSTADTLAGAQSGKTTVENNFLSEKESRQLDKEMQDCKASGGDCNKVVEKYIDISNKNSKELIEACSGGGVACVTWEELIQGATNVANDAHPSQIRLDEKLKDPDAAALVNYLNGTDLKFLQDNITTGDRVLSVVSDPTSWPVLVMGGKAIITNTVTNGKELLIAAGTSMAGSAAIQYGVHGEVKLSDVIGAGVIGAITAGKGYNPTVTWNAAGGYYQAELKGDDPFLGGLLSKAGAATGYAAGNILKIPADKIFNPVSKQYEWIPTGVWTITKPAPQNSLPSILGNTGNAAASGTFTEGMNEALKNKEVKQ